MHRAASMVWRALAVIACVAGCTPASGEPAPASDGRLRFHMRQRFSDARTIERMLITGRLEDARSLAFMLSRPARLDKYSAEAGDLALAAGALATASTLDEALYAQARIATACARCHANVHKLPVFRMPSRAPPDRPTVAAQMARHQWAVDRLWEGLIAASSEHWRAGLYALATSRFPGTRQPELATQLQRVARAALDRPAQTLAGRATTYNDLLVTCAGCHARATAMP